MGNKNNEYRPADKLKGERNEYIQGKDGMIHTVITYDKKGNEICRWEDMNDEESDDRNEEN